MVSYPLWTSSEHETTSPGSGRELKKRGQCQSYPIALCLPSPSFTALLDSALLSPLYFITMVKAYHAMAWDSVVSLDTQSGHPFFISPTNLSECPTLLGGRKKKRKKREPVVVVVVHCCSSCSCSTLHLGGSCYCCCMSMTLRAFKSSLLCLFSLSMCSFVTRKNNEENHSPHSTSTHTTIIDNEQREQ